MKYSRAKSALSLNREHFFGRLNLTYPSGVASLHESSNWSFGGRWNPQTPPTPPATSTHRSQVGGNGKVLYATSTNITFRGSDVSCAAGIWIYIGIPPLKAKLFFQIFCLSSQTWKNFYTHIRACIYKFVHNACICPYTSHPHIIIAL